MHFIMRFAKNSRINTGEAAYYFTHLVSCMLVVTMVGIVFIAILCSGAIQIFDLPVLWINSVPVSVKGIALYRNDAAIYRYYGLIYRCARTGAYRLNDSAGYNRITREVLNGVNENRIWKLDLET